MKRQIRQVIQPSEGLRMCVIIIQMNLLYRVRGLWTTFRYI